MKKLLYITNGINGAAGLERVLSVKASYLADKLNYEVHILTLNNGNTNLFYEFTQKESSVYFPGAPFMMGAILTIVSIGIAVKSLTKSLAN